MQQEIDEDLLKSVEDLKKSEVRSLVTSRIRQFKENRTKSSPEIFKELCFCILCANYTAERSIQIQRAIGDNFLSLSESQLRDDLKALGYRFPNLRAEYIVEARRYKDSLKNIIASFGHQYQLREWLIKNVRGIGHKEASHFLRNIGFTDLAILDFHIINLLARRGMIEKPKTLTKRRYLEIEELLRKIAKKANLSLGELDLYLWYTETGRVLK